MIYRTLGRNGPRISQLGLGGSPLAGGLFQQRESEGVAVVQSALDRGVNFIDTSDNYGMGRSEMLIGRAIAGRRSQVLIATKGGASFSSLARAALAARPLMRPLRAMLKPMRRKLNLARDAHKRYDYTAQGLRAALEASLRRLRVDHVDVYQLYNPTPASAGFDEAVEVLERFRSEGKARFVGLSINHVSDAAPLLRRWRPDTLQLPVSLIDTEACGGLLAELHAAGTGVIGRSVLGQGLLTDAQGHVMADESSHYTVEGLRARRARALACRSLVAPGRTLAQAAVRFVMQQPDVDCALFAAVDRVQLEENLGALESPPLDEQQLQGAMKHCES